MKKILCNLEQRFVGSKTKDSLFSLNKKQQDGIK